MDQQRKHAYRYLLYQALLDIRPVYWLRFRNPLSWRARLRLVRRAGAVADWLHNLALFSSIDFARFDERRFWDEYQRLLDRFPDSGLEIYRSAFEQELSARDESRT